LSELKVEMYSKNKPIPMLGGMCCEWFSSSTFNSINLVFSPDSYNWQQNELRHLALKGLFDIFLTSKEENKAFPPHPLHSMLCHCSSYL